MDTLYLLLKFLHVAGVIVWVGGAVTLVVLNSRMAATGDAAAMAALGRQSEAVGAAVIGSAAVLAVLAGFGAAGVGRWSFGLLWIVWGIIGFILSMLIGVVAVQRTAKELSGLAREAGPGDSRVASLQGRMRTLNAINLLLLASVVWAMVFKPTL